MQVRWLRAEPGPGPGSDLDSLRLDALDNFEQDDHEEADFNAEAEAQLALRRAAVHGNAEGLVAALVAARAGPRTGGLMAARAGPRTALGLEVTK